MTIIYSLNLRVKLLPCIRLKLVLTHDLTRWRFFNATLLGNETVLDYLVNIFTLSKSSLVIKVKQPHLIMVVGMGIVLVMRILYQTLVGK